MGSNLIITMAIAAAGTGCSWAHPAANPYRGDPLTALADFRMLTATRRQLRVLMAAHRYTDVVTITRDGIAGQRQYGDLREMHSGSARLCHGNVDRSAWSPTHQERALVYCVDGVCVLVPEVCNNVSLVTRKPEEALPPTGADAPIDISPAAGPPLIETPADTSIVQFPDGGPLDLHPGVAAPGVPGAPDSPSGGGPIGGGGVIPCCETGPIGPPVPPVPPISAVPEIPAWALFFAGVSLLDVVRRKRPHPIRFQ
jgi:hypothetical protein